MNYMAIVLNYIGLGGMSVNIILDGVRNRSLRRYHSHKVIFKKIETVSSNLIYISEKKSIYLRLYGKSTSKFLISRFNELSA